MQNSWKRLRNFSRQFESLEDRHLLAGDLIISEFMASNKTTLQDEDGDFPDWVEIYNPTNADMNLNGWHLTDDNANLDKWSLPDQVLPAGNFLIVFASSKDRTTAGQPLHTNFSISSSGEFLALTKTDAATPGGVSVVSQFNVAFPNRPDLEVSYGIGQSVTVDSLVSKGDSAKLFYPTDGNLGTTWTQTGFDDSSWDSGKNAIGYEQSVPGFTVQDAKSSTQIASISQALSLLSGVNRISETIAISPVVNFLDTGGAGNYGDSLPFPNNTSSDDNDFAIRATGTVFHSYIRYVDIWDEQ